MTLPISVDTHEGSLTLGTTGTATQITDVWSALDASGFDGFIRENTTTGLIQAGLFDQANSTSVLAGIDNTTHEVYYIDSADAPTTKDAVEAFITESAITDTPANTYTFSQTVPTQIVLNDDGTLVVNET